MDREGNSCHGQYGKRKYTQQQGAIYVYDSAPTPFPQTTPLRHLLIYTPISPSPGPAPNSNSLHRFLSIFENIYIYLQSFVHRYLKIKY